MATAPGGGTGHNLLAQPCFLLVLFLLFLFQQCHLRPTCLPSGGPTVHSVGPTVHSVGSTVHSVGPTVHSVGPTVHSVGPTVHSEGPTVRSVGPTVHSVGPTVHSEGPTVRSEGPTVRSSTEIMYEHHAQISVTACVRNLYMTPISL